MRISKKLIMSLLSILLGALTIQPTLTQDPKSEISYPKIFTKTQIAKPIQPEAITPKVITQKNQTILSLKKQLSSSLAQNPKLQKLKKEKKGIKTRIEFLTNEIQTAQTKNKSILEAYQKAKAAKNIPSQLKTTVNALTQEIKNNQLQLLQYYTKLQELKGAIKKADPSRQNLIKKLHKTNQELLEIKLAQHTKSIAKTIKK